MNKHQSYFLSSSPTWGALQIAGVYLLVGGLWILFSDQLAARIALSEQMLTAISLYKGWGYVLVTALLLYLLIQRHTAKLRARELQLHRILDAMPSLISYVNKDQQYQFTNRAYQDWFEGPVVGKHVQEVLGVSAYKSVSPYIDRALNGETVRYETEVALPDGQRFVQGLYVPDIELDGKVEGYFALIHDLTDQKEAREELQLWADAFEGCYHGIAIGDPHTNRIAVCNPAFAGMLKRSVEEIVGSAILSLYASSDHERVRRNIERADQIGHARFEANMIRGGRDSSRFPVQMDIVSVLGDDGELLHRVVTAQDISERKQAEENLRKNEERYRNLFENNPHPMWTYDRKTLGFLDVNEAAIQKYGYSRSEFLRMTIADIRPAEDVERLKEHLRQALPGLRQSDGWRHRLKDGTVIDVEITSHTIEIEGREAALVVAQEITERKRAEENLKESEAKYRTLVEHLPAIIYISEPDQYVGVSYVSPQIASYGFDSNAWLTDPQLWFRHIHPDDQERVTAKLKQFEDNAESFKAEYRLRLPSGESRWFHDESIRVKDQDGKTILKQGFMLDITERKQAEEKIFLQALWLDQINDAVITSDQSLVITGWNRAAERVYGWKAEEVIGKKGEEVLKSEFFSKTRAEVLQEVKESGEFSAEIIQSRKDGSKIHIETRTVTLRDERGKAIGYVSVNRDITERKQVEEENKSLARFPAENPNPVMRATHKGRLVYANNASGPLLKDWGVSLGDYLPAHWIKLIEELTETRSAKTLEAECGETTYSFIIAYAPNANDVNIYGRDVTEGKRAEEALQRSEALLLQTSEMAKVGGWELDLQTMTLIWSREIYRIYEIDIFDEPRLEDAINYYTAEARPVVRAAVQQAIEDGQPFNFELPMVTAKGRHIWVRAIGQAESRNAKPVRLFGTLQDITERKQAEEYLRRFELLSQHSRDIILFMGRDDGRILEANEAAVQTYGYSREELLSLTVRDLRAADTIGLTAEQMAQADARGILFETTHQRKDGTTFPVEVSSQGATIGGVRTLISIVRDITERKNAEKALTESEARFRSLFEQSADAILLLEDGIFTDCNQATVQLMGANSEEEILSHYPTELSPEYQPDGQPSSKKAEEMINLAIEKGSHRFEWLHRRMDGTDFPVEVLLTPISTGKHQMIHAVWRDITERKRIEKALQQAHDELELKVQERTAALSEANALLKALMDNIPDHIYFKDLQSRFIRTSKSQATLLGLNDPTEAVGTTDFDFFPHAARSFAEEQEVMRSGKPLIDLEEWVVWPDGRETWVSTTKMPLRNAQGQTIGIFGISHDITERKRAEQEIKQLNADLEKQAEKLQAANKELEAFSYSVSHDLRAPLRAIDGYTRILVEDYESNLDAEGKRICGVISREARRMGQLIDDLLAFSRLGRKEMYTSKVDMRGMVVSVLNELLKEEERARLDFQIGKLPAIKADSSLIRQVWFNLLANAIKFTAKKERAVIEIGSKTSKEEVIYSVRDSGAGFDMEYGNKLFGVFQRLHSESEFDGTGVGLAIVQRIIHRHEGRVWAEGEVGKGATFYFALPRKEDHHE